MLSIDEQARKCIESRWICLGCLSRIGWVAYIHIWSFKWLQLGIFICFVLIVACFVGSNHIQHLSKAVNLHRCMAHACAHSILCDWLLILRSSICGWDQAVPSREVASATREDSGLNITSPKWCVMLDAGFFLIAWLYRIMHGSMVDNVDTCPMLPAEAGAPWPSMSLNIEIGISVGWFLLWA